MPEDEEKVENQWKSCESDFPGMVQGWHGGHEGRSRLLWLYQPASEHPKPDGTKMYLSPHIYLGYCCWPYSLKLRESGEKKWDYGDPFFVGLWANGRAGVTQWRYLEKPTAPFDALEVKYNSGAIWSYPNEDESQSLPQGTDPLSE